MQALILAGGEGTRLRPLTSTIPKPVVPLVNRPFIAYMVQWLRRHGVDDVILACGFMAGDVRDVLGDGSRLGVRLRYLEEPQPLGTAGALKFAAPLLDRRFLMLNGDVLTDLGLTSLLARHEQTGAAATLALVAVTDASAYGLVRCGADGVVQEFVEKPTSGAAGLVNAGVYVLEREVLELIAPAPVEVSIERDVFPRLVGHGLYGQELSGYWLDIGTPERYLQASFDILDGRIEIGEPAVVSREDVNVDAAARVEAHTVLGEGVHVAEGAHISNSVLLDGVRIGARARIDGSILGPRVVVGPDCRVADAVLGEGAMLSAGHVLPAGARIFPGVSLPERAISS